MSGFSVLDGTAAAVDITDEKLQLATELGADFVIDTPAPKTRWSALDAVLHGDCRLTGVTPQPG